MYLSRTLWQWECVEEKAIHLMAAGKQTARQGPQASITFKGTPHSDLLPPARPYLLAFPSFPKMVPPSGDQAFNTQAYEEHFTFKA
jgi:hypothetical protein